MIEKSPIISGNTNEPKALEGQRDADHAYYMEAFVKWVRDWAEAGPEESERMWSDLLKEGEVK
jgi:hypothetical protein